MLFFQRSAKLGRTEAIEVDWICVCDADLDSFAGVAVVFDFAFDSNLGSTGVTNGFASNSSSIDNCAKALSMESLL